MSNAVSYKLSRPLRALAISSLLALVATGAQAQQSCQEDFQKLTARRMAGIQKLNALGKAGKGKMDPMAACPAARSLVAVEGEMLAYMVKNKDWCSIPDNVMEGFKAARGKTQAFASQACAVAAKVKKMQAEQKAQAAAGAAGGGMMAPPKLPSGPL